MLSLTVLLGLSSLAVAHFPPHHDKKTHATRPSYPIINTTEDITSLPGHYLAANITSQHFFNNSCTAESLSVRKEWRSLTHEEKMAFIDAELCVMSLPGTSGLPGAVSRFDDFQAAHQQGTNATDGDQIHYTVSSRPTLEVEFVINIRVGHFPCMAQTTAARARVRPQERM